MIVATLCGAARSAARTRDAPGRRPGLDTYKSVFRQHSLPKHFSGVVARREGRGSTARAKRRRWWRSRPDGCWSRGVVVRLVTGTALGVVACSFGGCGGS